MPMKVTVCFDKVKVLVPCGDGDFPVSELIDKAIVRYRKAIGKLSDYWVSVHTLRTVTEDSILDQDDTLCDVVDDREQLIADFEEQCGPRTHHNGGDGHSVNSVGTVSPEVSQSAVSPLKPQHQRGCSLDSHNDVVVTALDISFGSGLTIRRGSEPSLISLDGHGSSVSPDKQNGCDPTCQDDKSPSKNNTLKPIIKKSPITHKEREKTPPFNRFARDTWRQSLGTQPAMFKWFEAQERQEEKFKQNECQDLVQGGATSPDAECDMTDLESAAKKGFGVLLCLKNDGTPLGIHVVPDFNEDEKESGLMIQSIEPGGRVDQDGRLKVHDRIIEINAHDLHGISFPKAQEIFRNAMTTDEVRLKIIKHSVLQMPKRLPPSVLPKPRGHSPTKPSPLTLPLTLEVHSLQSSPNDTSIPLDISDGVHRESKISADSQSLPQSSTSINTVQIYTSCIKPTSPLPKNAPPIPPTRNTLTVLTSDLSSESFSEINKNSSTKLPTPSGTLTKSREIIIAPTNTKKIGKRVEIELMKGPAGLGFSVTTRDNPTSGDSPIYIKNILPQGAAVTDGRLKAGDRLLEVNGIEMTGKSQSDAVSILRNTTLGSSVKIVVSRQDIEEEEEEQDERFRMPRELPGTNSDGLDLSANDLHTKIFQPPEKSGDDGTVAVMKNKELLEFNIPLNDTGSAGLGVSVKGKTLTTEEGTQDLGIFVKAVIHGGAASKDGRLQVNDKLLEVNEISLVNHANTEAMELLRNAMQFEGPVPGCINIKVARKIGAPFSSPNTVRRLGEHELGGVMAMNKKELNNNDSLDNIDVTDGRIEEKSSLKVKGDDGANNVSNPNIVLEKGKGGNGLRNKSYTKAVHENGFESRYPKRDKNFNDLSKQRPRPHSTLGIARSSPTGSNSSSSEDLDKEPAWLHGPDWSRHASLTSEESELSVTGDGFSRDGFGRQSMSEKRKGHTDPRNCEIFKKVKSKKEIRRANNRSPAPPSNLKRCSSLENLTTMHDADVSTSFEEDDESPRPALARKRGGNESFRAAVDRSYDPVPHLDMDPLEEENSEEGSFSHDPTNSTRSSASDNTVSDDLKKKGAKNIKENKKSGGLLKGFILKLGKGRKNPLEDVGKSSSICQSEVKKEFINDEGGGTHHQEHIQTDEQKWKQAQVDQERVQEQYRRLQEQQQQQQQPIISNQQYLSNPCPIKSVTPQNVIISPPVSNGAELNKNQPMSRAERIQQLRADHQRRHQDRHGHYPQEEKEEQYEKMIQEEERRGTRFTKDDYFFYQKYGQSATPSQIGQQDQNLHRLANQNQAERCDSHLDQEQLAKGSNVSNDISQPGARAVNNANVLKYNNHIRPPSRGPIGFSEQSCPQNHPFQAVQQQPQYIQQDPTPSGERHNQQKFNGPHCPTPTNENISNYYRNVSGNYPSVQRENTPSDIIVSDKWNYVPNDASRMGTGNKQVNTKRIHLTRHEILPHGGGCYRNAAYNDPVYTAMAARRPVKTLMQQPNSAKV